MKSVPSLMLALTLTACGGKATHSSTVPEPEPSSTMTDIEAQNFVSMYCSRCHTGDQPKGGVKVDSLATAKISAMKAADKLESKAMPPSRTMVQPTDEERTKMTVWLRANKSETRD